METEGVIKFVLDHQWQALPDNIDIADLEAARSQLKERGLIGQDSARYGGLGFGNLSQRYHDDQFIVSGSQTGELPGLLKRDYALVVKADLATNRIWSQGEIKPSSESTTHALLYQLSGDIGAVIHVHSPEIWHRFEDLDLLYTPEDAPYGSQQLVKSVTALWEQKDLKSRGVFVMRGHQDGVMAFSGTVKGALANILALHQKCGF
ncbi:class II aldolase/adducin family protein [Hahella ganghwensis]|uniref:class II aldolase/adducin family protein n=1 Tax=Hahella ganghwensis TaxID=286420 RepID=UPI000370D1D1|nr:class II aldolase/adducin family protein [Hahella ganghwensis]